jgi:hypothetical protein
MPAPLADQLARKSDDVADKLAAGDACSALDSARELHAQAVAAVGAHQVPRPLQDLLLTSTEELANRIACVPVVKKPPKKNDDAHEHKHEHEHGRDEKGKKH